MGGVIFVKHVTTRWYCHRTGCLVGRPKGARISECHPEIPHRAHGICRRCYGREYARQPHVKQMRHNYYVKTIHKQKLQMKAWRVRNGLVAVAGNCSICNKFVRKLHRDHNHTTEQLRGSLCPSCNLIIGLAHEDIELLRKVVDYIEFWKSAGFPNGKYTRG